MNEIRSGSGRIPRAALEEASRWFRQLHDEPADAGAFARWQHWLAASSDHRSAYEAIEDTVLRMQKCVAQPPLPSAQELAQDRYEGLQAVAEWRFGVGVQPDRKYQQLGARKRTVALRRRMAMAASVLLASLFAVWLGLQRPRAVPHSVTAVEYLSGPGERRVVHLLDGSIVTLDADSMLRVRLEAHYRAVTLARGEAFFDVAKDKTRPFVVSAGMTQITAVGTEFDVRLGASRTVVAVIQGRVVVATIPEATPLVAGPRHHQTATPRLTAQVGAGQGVSSLENGELQAMPTPEVPLATAWMQGHRQYRDEQLQYVLADMERYSGKRIEVGKKAADLRFTGTLELSNSDAWLRALPVALPVIVTVRADGTLIVERK